MSTKLHTKSYSNNRLFLTVNPNEDIPENDPVRIVDAVVEGLDLKEFKKLYKEKGRTPYHPKMMLKDSKTGQKRVKYAPFWPVFAYIPDFAS